jgi:hypothetical protein
VRRPIHEIAKLCQLACPVQSLFNLITRQSQALQSISYLGFNGLIEELGIGILEHQPGMAKQLINGVLDRVESVNENLSNPLAMMKMGYQSDTGAAKGGFAASTCPCDQHTFSRAKGQVKAIQCPRLCNRVAV